MNTEQRSSAIVSSSTCGHLLCQNQACFQQELAQRSIPITKGGNQIPPLPPCCRCLAQVYKRCALGGGRRSVLAQQSRAGFSAASRGLQLLTQPCKNTAGRIECSQQCQSLSRGQGSQGRTLAGVLHRQSRAEAAQTTPPGWTSPARRTIQPQTRIWQ